MGNMSRSKGARGEREAIQVLKDELGDVLASELRRNLAQTRDGGVVGDLLGLGPWAIEIKRASKPLFAAWWEQALEQSPDGYVPVLMYRLDHAREWRVRLHIADVLGAEFGDWPRADLSGCVEFTVQGFAALVRERAGNWREQIDYRHGAAAARAVR